jgi:spore maturation protein CgeB
MYLRYLIIGIISAALIHLLMSASCWDNLVNPKKDDVDQRIQESLTKVEAAFLSGDTTQLKSVLTPTAQEFYSQDFKNIHEIMDKIGNAMKERKISLITENYAEVIVNYEGKEFIMTLALQDDDSWKLIRF